MAEDPPTRQMHTPRRRLSLFIAVGATNTVFYFLVYNAMRAILHPYGANTLAVTASILFSFWANRRFTFQFAGSERGARQLLLYATIFLMTLAVSSGALAILFEIVDDPTRLQENLILIGSSGALVLLRYELMRRWVFSPVSPVQERPEAT